ncbi:hypothetical protein ACO0K9_05420 [Undibacterium sp. Ji50W]|uniref:hypothetical protein n=1 Tax=Undibacterium sp. Ji50W TaxID=3413041 RepID=UPI003BF12080
MSANNSPSSQRQKFLPGSLIEERDNDSGRGDYYPAPDGVDGWSWGAFLLALYWTARHKRGIGFLLFIPIVGFFVAFKIGRTARLWAWHNIYWDSLEHFNRVQRRWTIVAFSLYALIFSVIAVLTYPETQKNEARRQLVVNGRLAINDAVHSAKDVSRAVGDYILSHHAFPKNIDQAGFESQLPADIKSIEIDQKNGLIAVTMNIEPFKDKVFYLAPRYEGKQEILWRCLKGDFTTWDIPHECRYDATEDFSIR